MNEEQTTNDLLYSVLYPVVFELIELTSDEEQITHYFNFERVDFILCSQADRTGT
jgi:hypothetical protein